MLVRGAPGFQGWLSGLLCRGILGLWAIRLAAWAACQGPRRVLGPTRYVVKVSNPTLATSLAPPTRFQADTEPLLKFFEETFRVMAVKRGLGLVNLDQGYELPEADSELAAAVFRVHESVQGCEFPASIRCFKLPHCGSLEIPTTCTSCLV